MTLEDEMKQRGPNAKKKKRDENKKEREKSRKKGRGGGKGGEGGGGGRAEHEALEVKGVCALEKERQIFQTPPLVDCTNLKLIGSPDRVHAEPDLLFI